nr:hypothetical protein Iba_chr04bCG15400 [Ipomoea batatas]
MSDTDSQNLSFDNYDAMVEYNTVIKEVQQFTEVQGELVGTSTEHYAKDPSTKTIPDLNEAGTSTRVTSNQTLFSAPSSSRPIQIQAPILTSGRHKCLSAEQTPKDYATGNLQEPRYNLKKKYLPNTKNVTIAISSAIEPS